MSDATDADMDCGGFFDHIDDFLDVPNDFDLDLDTFPGIWSGVGLETERSLPPCSDSVFSGSSDISAELSVPYEDIVQMEWLSSFVKDSFSGGGTGIHVEGSPGKSLSVMDSSSSCSADKTSSTVPIAPSHCGRARSKRPRPKAVNFRPIAFPPPSAVSDTSAESRLVIKIPNDDKNKTNPKKLKSKQCPTPTDLSPVRKCLHCEISKTPQWRAGPLGAKTLCNACGVRYKSGRLFPEYRPAASPSFVPSVHSNSDKKVLEMRHKDKGVAIAIAMES